MKKHKLSALMLFFIPTAWAGMDDLDGDGGSDILWVNSSPFTGMIENIVAHTPNGNQTKIDITLPCTDSYPIDYTDYNGDGAADVLSQNEDGTYQVFYSFADPLSQNEYIANTVRVDLRGPIGQYTIVSTGDYDGDGADEWLVRPLAFMTEENAAGILGELAIIDAPIPVSYDGANILNATSPCDAPIITWQIFNSGNTEIRSETNFFQKQPAVINVVSAPEWKIAGSPDLNGDGTDDILWANTQTGVIYGYLMQQGVIWQFRKIATVPVNTGWAIAGTGDFDGSGTDDILWRNGETGQNWIYFMRDDGFIGASKGLNIVSDMAWQVARVGDYSNDGNDDIYWHNLVTGSNYVYYMNGSHFIGEMFSTTNDITGTTSMFWMAVKNK